MKRTFDLHYEPLAQAPLGFPDLWSTDRQWYWSFARDEVAGKPEIHPVMLRSGVVYRYGSSRKRAEGPNRDWVCVTPEPFDVSEDVIDKCALLDFTISRGHMAVDFGEFNWDESPVQHAGQRRSKALAWNVAAWRADFEVRQQLPAWFGEVGAIMINMHSGRAWLPSTPGAPDIRTYVSRARGAVQCIDRRGDFASSLALLICQELPARAHYLH